MLNLSPLLMATNFQKAAPWLIRIALLVVLSILFWPFKKPRVSDILEQELKPYPNEVTQVKPGVASTTVREEAFKLYEQERYDPALALFGEMLMDTTDYELVFYRGQSLLALEQYQTAVDLLEKIPETSEYYHRARWYMALMEAARDKRAAARRILNALLEDQEFSFRREEAQDLLRALSQ